MLPISFSLDVPRIFATRFPTLRASLLYDRIILSDPSVYKIENQWTKDEHSDEEYLALIRNLVQVEIVEPPKMTMSVPVGRDVELSGELKDSYYQHFMPYELGFAKQNKIDILIPNEFFEDYVRLAQSDKDKLVVTVKRSRLKTEIFNYVIEKWIPGFKPNYDLPPKTIKKFAKGLSDWVFAFCEEESGYTLNKEILGRVDQELIDKMTTLERLNKDAEFGSLVPDKLEVSKLIASVTLGSIIPGLKETLDTIEKLYDFRKVEQGGLKPAISLIFLRNAFANFDTIYEKNCPICNMTIAELEAIEEAEIEEKIFANLCEEHKIAYLNCRKIGHLIGRRLLECMFRSVPRKN
jgi:hypothetical protein